MSRRPVAGPQITLDNLTLAHKEGWLTFASSEPRSKPEPLRPAQLNVLDAAARAVYDRARRKWHANLGPIRTPQLGSLHDDLWIIIDSNDQDGNQAKGAVAIDAFPGLGKTTAVLAFAKEFHRREIAEAGGTTDAGHERLPVCRVGLTGNTGMKDFNRALMDFFAHPGLRRGTSSEFASRALDCVLSCETRLVIVDDMHFLKWRQSSGIEVSNHFKHIANEFPVTLLFVGVALTERGLFSEGDTYESSVLAQTARRTTRLTMAPFHIGTDEARAQWRSMLLAIEQRVVLARTHPGMIADKLSDYLFARSTGHIGSLMTLINRGCQAAIRSGAEILNPEVLDRIKGDEGAEQARAELDTALAAGRISSKPSRRKATR